MNNEIQLPVITDTVLRSMYCIIELTVNYTNRPVYIACNTNKDYERVIAKINNDYQNDNYILAACEHKSVSDNENTLIECNHYRKQINLIL